MDNQFIMVKISAASARLMFTPCGPECISAGCGGNCCDAPSRKTGCLITIHPTEAAQIAARGGVVQGNFLQPRPGTRGCPFKVVGLCALHGTPDKPFGCIASPFTLNSNNTLIVRNRYKLLPCYRGNGKKQPAYRAFHSSLELLFGRSGADDIANHLERGGGDLSMAMNAQTAARLTDNDAAKRAAA